MAWHLPPLNALRAFEAAGRHSSITQAAEELYVTPGAVSRQIKQLEGTLGRKLFTRTNREVRLTAESALFLTALTDAFRRLDAASTKLRVDGRDRPLRIMCSGIVATRWLFPRLREFHTLYPNRQVMLTTSLTTATAAFETDSADLVVRLGREPWPADLVAHFLFPSELIPICSPELRRRGPPLAEPRDLRRHTLLYSERRPDVWRSWLAFAGLRDADTFAMQGFESAALMADAASEGLGVALGERHLIADEVRKGRLVTPFALAQRQADSFYLIYQRRAQSRPQFREFRDWLLGGPADRAGGRIEKSASIAVV